MICTPLMMMNVTVNNSAGTMIDRGMIASDAVSLGQNASRRKMAPTAYATTRLVTPLAAATPTPGVDVFVPTPPTTPAAVVGKPSARTPRVTDGKSGRTQFASLIR